MTVGLYGKMPAHGDFVRRHLPKSFIDPWDAWLAAGIEASRARMGAAWDEAWRRAPAWRFCLPPGACGPDPVSGVVLPSEDSVGRQFPLTAAAVLPGAMAGAGDAVWFDRLEQAVQAGRSGSIDADAVCRGLPEPDAFAEPPDIGWWTNGVADGTPAMAWPVAGLPPIDSFLLLLDPGFVEGGA